MDNEKLEDLLRTVDPAKRALLKKILIGAAFAVPMVASYSVKDLAYGTVPCDTTVLVTQTLATTVTVTVTTSLSG